MFAEGRTYLGPVVAKEMLERGEAVSFGGGASAASYAGADGMSKTYGTNDRQGISGKTSGDLQIPFDPTAPLTPRLLGRDPSPRLPNNRVVVMDGRRESLGDTKDTAEDLVSSEPGAHHALYLGIHGELYDANYEPLPRSLRIRGDLDSNPAKYFEQQKNTRTFEVSPFPQPELDHESFFEWEQEVLVWKDRTEKQLRDVRQPVATGRTFYRPKFGGPYMTRKGSSELLLSTPPDTLVSPPSSSPDPTSPDGTREKLDVSNAHGANAKFGSSGSPVRSLPSNGAPRTTRGEEEEFDSEIPSWDSILVPAEPNPVNYNSYEDYKVAMLRWSALVAQTSPKIVPSPRQLPTLLQLSNHTLISPNPLQPQEAAALSYYHNSYYPQLGLEDRNSDENDELADDADDDALFDGPNERFRHSDSIGSSETRDDSDDTSTRKLRRKPTHDSAPGSSPGSPLGFDKRKSLKISRLPLTMISQNSWWDSDANPALSSPQDSPSDVYPSPSNSPHSRLHRSNGRTPRSRMARTKFSSQNAAPLPSRPGLATMSHPSSSMDSARIATPPGTLDALPPMIPKSARGREASADNSPFAPRSSSGPQLNITGQVSTPSSQSGEAVSSASPSTQQATSGSGVPSSMSRGSIILGSNSRPSSQKVLPVMPETRDQLESLFSDLIDRQNARYAKFGRFGCDPVRGEGVIGAPNTSPMPEINYKLLVSQSVASKKALTDAHRTHLWQSHPSRKGDLDVPYQHLSPLGTRGPHQHQTSPVQLPALQSWANALASRPRESHRTAPANSLIYQALLEVLGTAGITENSSPAVHTLALLDVPSFVSLLATEFMSSSSSKDDSSESKKSPRRVALVHTFATWLFPTARKSKTREMSTSPRGSSGTNGKKENMRESPSKESVKGGDSRVTSIESAPQSTDTLSATPTRNQGSGVHGNSASANVSGAVSRALALSPMYRVRHFQALLKLSQEIQNPKVLFKLSFLLYLCISHRPKQSSEVFAILFEHLAATAPKPEDEVFSGGSGAPGDVSGLSDDEGGLQIPSHRARSNSNSSASYAHSELTSSTVAGMSGIGGGGPGSTPHIGGSSLSATVERAKDFRTYASRQSGSDSLESALYSTIFLLNYGRSCPVDCHTWHKSLLPEFPDFKSASMLPNAYQLFSARGAAPAPPSSLTMPSTPSASSSATSESFFDGTSHSLPSSGTATCASSATTITSSVGVNNLQPSPQPGSHLGSSGTGSEHSAKYSSSSSGTDPSSSSTHSGSPTWEIKDTATRLALCIDRAHQLQLIAKFVSEALAPSYGSSSSSSSSSASHTTSTPPSKSSSSSSSLGSQKGVVSSLPFPFLVSEPPVTFTRRLFENWRAEVGLVVHIMTKNLRDEELGTDTSSESSSDDSDPVHKAAKTMPNLPSESARLIRFMMGRTGLGSRSRLASTLSHFTVSWLLQFDRHVNFWNTVCQYEPTQLNEEKIISGPLISPSPAKSSALKITIAVNPDAHDFTDIGDDERLASSTTSGSTFSGGLMPSHSVNQIAPARLSSATSAATIRMVLQRPGAKFVELTNHALKSKLVHVRQFAANLANLCIHHDPLASVGATSSSHSGAHFSSSAPSNAPSLSTSLSLDKSSSARGNAMSASSSHGYATVASGGSSHASTLASLAARFPPQPWLHLWLSRLGGLALLDGLTHGLPTRSPLHGYGFTERGNVPTFSSTGSSSNLLANLSPTSPRGQSSPSLMVGPGANTSSNSNSPAPHATGEPRSATPTPSSHSKTSHERPRGRRTSISVSGVSSLLHSTGGSSASPAPLQAVSLQSSPLKQKPGAQASRNLATPESSATVSRSTSGRELSNRLGARQELQARQEQRQRLLLGAYQPVPSASAQVWHALFWKALGPAVSLFESTTHPLQFIAGKSQLSTAPTWMYPHVPQDQSHALLEHLAYDPIFVNHGSHSPSSTSSSSISSYFPSFGSSAGSHQGTPISIERRSGIAFILGASSNPNQVRWSWDGAQGVPSVTAPPMSLHQSRSDLTSGNSTSSVPLDVLALMNPFAALDSALLQDAPLLALRDGKLFHRSLGRLFKADSGPHASVIASTLVMVASSLRRQSLLVPKSNRSLGSDDLADSLGGSGSSPSSAAASFTPEVELSLDHVLRLLVFVTTPIPTHMHSASATAQSAFFRESTTPASARDGMNPSNPASVAAPATITTPLNMPIGGERASFFKTRASSIRLLQLVVTSSSILSWLTGVLLLPLAKGGAANAQGSSGLPTLSSVASSAAPSTLTTPTSSKPSTPQASAGAAVSPLAMSDLSGYQNPSPSRRGKKDSSSKGGDKDKEKDKEVAGRRPRKGGLNISGIISTGSTEALSPRSTGSTIDGSPESSATSGGGPGGMIVGRSGGAVPSSSSVTSSNAPTTPDGSPMSVNSKPGVVEPLHLKAHPMQVYASHPLSSTPSSLENALTPLLSSNTSPPVSPRAPASNSSGTPPSSFVSSTSTPFHSAASLGSSSDSITSPSGRSSLVGSSNTLPNGPALSDASAAVWITMIEGLISVVRFGTDVASAMAASEALRTFVFARPTVMDVFTKPLSAQVAVAFAPLLKEKKDRKGSTVTGSIEELILQARQSGASRGHHSSSLGATSQFGSSQPSNATTVSNYTTPSSWLVCNSMTSSSTNLSSHSSSPSALASEKSGWAVPTLEASLQILLRLHASLSVGQSPTISTSLFTHLVDGLNTTQPLPHIANSLYALNQLLCGPVAPMPPTNSSSGSSFPSSLVNALSSSGSVGAQGSSPSGGGPSLLSGAGSSQANSLLAATLAERHANHTHAVRLQKQLIAQFANPVVFGKIRAIFMRLLDDEFIGSIVDPKPQLSAPTPSIYILPHPASLAAYASASGGQTALSGRHPEEPSDSASHASKSHQSSVSVVKNSTSIFGGLFGGKRSKGDSASSASSSSPSLMRANATNASSQQGSTTQRVAHAVQTPIQPSLRPPIKSNVVLASQAAPGAYLAFVQLASLCHTMSLNHKMMKAAKASPEFLDVIKALSRFVPNKPQHDSKER